MRIRQYADLPSFDPITIALVRASCVRLRVASQDFAQEFYDCFFELAPSIRVMFPQDMTAQAERLLKALMAAVEALDRPEVLEPQLRAWGAWHRGALGVTDELYVYFGHALVRAVRNVLGPTETSLTSAWIAVYEWLAATMIDGAEHGDVWEPATSSSYGAGRRNLGLVGPAV